MGSDFTTEAFHMLLEGELAIKRVSMVSWMLGIGDGGTVDGNCKFTAGLPIIQVERSACSFGRAQPDPPCTKVITASPSWYVIQRLPYQQRLPFLNLNSFEFGVPKL